MVNACADPDYFRQRGGGSKPVQNFPGMRGGVQLFTRGGGVQKLISIEFDRTCDLPGMGSGPPTPPPPPPSGSAHA